MSSMPGSDPPAGAAEAAIQNAPEPPIVPPGSGWFQKLSSVLFIIFCFELGLFLLIYPWTDGWTDNFFAWAGPESMQTHWHAFWDNRYVRGCISGVGVVNLWIALLEVFRLFSRQPSKRG